MTGEHHGEGTSTSHQPARAQGPILVPVDGSRASLALLPVARAVAAIWNAQPHVLLVTNAPLLPGPEAGEIAEPGLAGLLLDQRTGDPGQVILKVVQEQASSLVIMATRGWTAGKTGPLGRVAAAVLRGCRCPLMLVGEEAGVDFVPEHTALSRLLLPLDGRAESQEPLDAAAPLIARQDAVVDVLHVLARTDGVAVEAQAFTVPRYLDQPYHEWEAWRREFAARFRHGPIPEPARVHVAVGHPAQEIVAAARAYHSDLIILAWRGILTGGHASTLRAVLRAAPCPLLIVPGKAPAPVWEPVSPAARDARGLSGNGLALEGSPAATGDDRARRRKE